jgi:UDP-3-O-acyl-N-acetylglucosamine deacetylase
MPRRTLAREATIEGIGLHTGQRVTARCVTAAPGQGILFRRVDLPGAPDVPARLSHVRSTERRTALGESPGTVETVEHLLAAAAALQLDDLIVELDGPEPPIGDGSFQPYLTALQQAGITDQPGEPVL